MAAEMAKDCVARAKIEEHEKRNEDRYQSLTDSIERVEKSVNKLFGNQWVAIISVVGLLLTILGTLLVYIWNTHNGVT